mgnify:CR=1 FL=1
MPGDLHELQVVDDDQTEAVLAPSAGAHARRTSVGRKRAAVVDEIGALRHLATAVLMRAQSSSPQACRCAARVT